MKFIFVSNYINHHQIPFCEAMRRRLGENFCFIQTEPMAEERVRMGWGVDLARLPYVRVLYGEPEAVGQLEQEIQDCDIALFGWTEREDLVQRRLSAGKPVIRESERLYREGQWKALSPRGLLRKYHDHTRWRSAEAYLLCNGAYVASDFAIVHAYSGKMFRWGYFPALRTYTEEQLRAWKGPVWRGEKGPLRLLWAGRFLALKHPEFAVHYAAHLREQGIPFHLDMIGEGELADALRTCVRQSGLDGNVTFHGFLPPGEVRGYMERADLFLFTSNHLEGWGAVLNEAMNSGCAVVAGSEAGAVPFLLRQNQNGLIFDGENEGDFTAKTDYLIRHPERIVALGMEAYRTIETTWNADCAAERLVRFADTVLGGVREGGFTVPEDGPMSPAPVLRPFMKVPEIRGQDRGI